MRAEMSADGIIERTLHLNWTGLCQPLARQAGSVMCQLSQPANQEADNNRR